VLRDLSGSSGLLAPANDARWSAFFAARVHGAVVGNRARIENRTVEHAMEDAADRRAAFLFDMDGTLADTMPFHLQAWVELVNELGVEMEPATFLRRTGGKMNRQILGEVFGLPMSDADLALFEERKESLFRTLCGPHLKPIAGLTEVLAESRRLGIAMPVATAAGKADRDFVLDGLDIARSFDAVIGAEDVRNGKSHPEVFLKVAGALRVDPSRCVVFEDAISGFEAADRAGMKVVGLATTLPARELQGHAAVNCTGRDYGQLQPQALVDALRLRDTT